MGELTSVATGLSQRGLTPVMKRRAAELVARQAGETAILLYSGQCRLEHDLPSAGRPRAGTPVEVRRPAPLRLRVGVVGQVNAGKSSLVNALAGRAVNLSGQAIHTTGEHDFDADVPGVGPVKLLDTPGLRHGETAPLDRIVGADMVAARGEAELTQRSREAAGRTWWDMTVDVVHSVSGGARLAVGETRRLFNIGRSGDAGPR